MPYDLFISYSRRDDERTQVATLKAQIESSFRTFAGRELLVFFDTHQIQGMDDWRQKIQRSLRESHLFLAVLSPNYLASPYCRWEWEDYVRYEAMRQCLGEGVAPVFFVTLPDAATPQADQAIARWIDEINHRQTFDLRPWHDAGEQALAQAHVRTTLEQLNASVRERLDRSERARLSPNNLIKHNPAFVGRVTELTTLRNALTKNKLGVVGAREGQMPGRATVQGLGGMGKTELALAYAHAFAWDYPGGRWQIPCEHTGDLRLALSRLAGPMQFEFTEDEKKDLALQFERVLRELQRRDRCLLILDNVSDPHLLEPEYLDRLPRDGHLDLIATTRLAPTAIPGSAQDSNFIAVDELPEEDALALLRSHQPEGRFASQHEDKEARQIVRLLRGFTLAVETAAIYLGRHPAPDACRRFRERLSPDLLRESEQAATDLTVAVRHRVRSLDETLAFTLATLTPEARCLLTLAALLPADQVAVPWLRVLGAERFPSFQDTASTAFRQPLDLLWGLRLFQRGAVVDAEGRSLIARMHRLVQDLVRQKTSAADLVARQQTVDDLVKERVGVLKQTTHWEDARWELEPLAALANQWAETRHPWAGWLLNEAGQRWHLLAEWTQAEPLMRRALNLVDNTDSPDHAKLAIALNNLASFLQETHRLGEAEQLFRRALAINEARLGPLHPDVAMSLNNLAVILNSTSRQSEAEPLLRRALSIWEQHYGESHPTVASACSNLAQLLESTNRKSEAEILFRRALTIGEAAHGSDHSEVATYLNNLASLLQGQSRLTEAEPLLVRAVSILERSFGESHPRLATALNSLALVLKSTNRKSEAEHLFRRALAIDDVCFGNSHPDVAAVLNNLAGLLWETDRREEAISLMHRSIAIEETCYGDHSLKVAKSLHGFAQLLQNTNHLNEAEPLMRRAAAIFERCYGENHPDVANALNNLAAILFAAGRLSEAEPIMRRVVSIDERSLGEFHPALITKLTNLAGLLHQMGRKPESELLLRRVIGIMFCATNSVPQLHPHLPVLLRNYVRLLTELEGRDAVFPRLESIAQESGISGETLQRIIRTALGG